jgi:hypothetical protein
MKNMEIWKLTLAWGCLIIFFLFPIMLPIIHLVRFPESHSFAQDFRYVGEYLRVVAAIIISLAGFNTVEIFRKP